MTTIEEHLALVREKYVLRAMQELGERLLKMARQEDAALSMERQLRELAKEMMCSFDAGAECALAAAGYTPNVLLAAFAPQAVHQEAWLDRWRA